jgi:hypothetical protein
MTAEGFRTSAARKFSLANLPSQHTHNQSLKLFCARARKEPEIPSSASSEEKYYQNWSLGVLVSPARVRFEESAVFGVPERAEPRALRSLVGHS